VCETAHLYYSRPLTTPALIIIPNEDSSPTAVLFQPSHALSELCDSNLGTQPSYAIIVWVRYFEEFLSPELYLCSPLHPFSICKDRLHFHARTTLVISKNGFLCIVVFAQVFLATIFFIPRYFLCFRVNAGPVSAGRYPQELVRGFNPGEAPNYSYDFNNFNTTVKAFAWFTNWALRLHTRIPGSWYFLVRVNRGTDTTPIEWIKLKHTYTGWNSSRIFV
jgi:hypothetical protein